jgi:hypothetical protein
MFVVVVTIINFPNVDNYTKSVVKRPDITCYQAIRGRSRSFFVLLHKAHLDPAFLTNLDDGIPVQVRYSFFT